MPASEARLEKYGYREGDALVAVGKPANLGVRGENLDAAAQKNVMYVWREEAMRGKLESKGDRAVFTAPAPGAYKVWVEVRQTGKTAAAKLAEAFHEIKVTEAGKIGLAIVGPSSGEVDRALAFSAEIGQSEGFREGLRLEWSADGRRLGSGSSASFGASQPGAYRIALAAYRKDGDGKEAQVARAEHTVTLSAKPKDDKKASETSGPAPGTATPTTPNDTVGGRKVTDLACVTCGNPTGVFDKEPFNGLQLRYGIGGVCAGPNKDSEGFTHSRDFDILGITGDTITVSGSSAPYKAACYSWAGSFWFQTEISLSVGDQTKTWSSPKPCDHKSDEVYRVSQPGHAFNLSLPVPKDKAEVETMTLDQSGRSVTGRYTNDGGEIVGEMNGNVLEGYWIENGANERCATARNGRYYWGRIRWTFTGDKFTGAWGYCDKPPTSGDWNGERIGAAPTGAGVNLARGKPASQSSTSQWSHANDAQGAVDGVIDGGYGFHTNHEANPWWQVDLGGNAAIDEVRLHNRLDCCRERARSVRILLSDDGRAWRTAYRHDGSLFGGKDGKPLKAPLGGASARYLRLQLNESNWFHPDEVEVMGRMSGAAATTTPAGRDYTAPRDQGPSGLAPPPAAAGAAGSSETSDELLNAIKSLKGLFGK